MKSLTLVFTRGTQSETRHLVSCGGNLIHRHQRLDDAGLRLGPAREDADHVLEGGLVRDPRAVHTFSLVRASAPATVPT